jgi:hypothetical protein
VSTGKVTDASKDPNANIFRFESKGLRQFRRRDWQIITGVSKDGFAFIGLFDPEKRRYDPSARLQQFASQTDAITQHNRYEKLKSRNKFVIQSVIQLSLRAIS